MDLSQLVQQCTAANASRQTTTGIMWVHSTHRPLAIGYKSIRQSEREEFILNAQPGTIDQAVGWTLWLTTTGYEGLCRLSPWTLPEGSCDCSAAGLLTDVLRSEVPNDLGLRKH